MNQAKTTGETWRDVKGAMQFFGCGKWTIERLAEKCNAKRKIGKRALYNVQRMSEWLEEGGGV